MYVVHLKLSVAQQFRLKFTFDAEIKKKQKCHCQHMMNSARLIACLFCFLASKMNFKLNRCGYT